MHVFNTFMDVDKSGSVDRNDFSLASANIGKMRGYNPGDVTYDVMKELLTAMWAGLQKQGDKDGSGDISAEEWVNMWDEYAKDPSAAAEWQQLYCKAIYQLKDGTNDGVIDANEFADVNTCFGLKKEESLEAFKKLSGGKPTINWEEFQELWKQYFTSDDPSLPGNYIFGRII